MTTYPKPQGSYISYFSNMVKQRGGINLAQGIPGFDPPRELVAALKNAADGENHQYPPGIGNFHLLDLIAGQYGVSRDNLLVVQGATEALSLLYTYINKLAGGRFSVLSFEPAYESYLQLPRIFGQEFIHYPLDGNFSFNRENLERTISQRNVKLVFVNSPGNPYGKIWGRDEIARLVSMANEMDFYLVFDSVYENLYFDVPPYIPVDLLSPNLFIASSFSKTFCITGWRVGYLIAHESHRDGIRAIHDYIGLCAPSLLQAALAAYLTGNNGGKDYIARYRRDVKESFGLLGDALREFGFGIPPIQGGCFIWAKLPSGWSDGFLFSSRLYEEQRVATIPGEHFSVGMANYVRFNIARPLDEVREASQRIGMFLGS
jgi:aspartate/methionine/tyrosine aminotransferase